MSSLTLYVNHERTSNNPVLETIVIGSLTANSQRSVFYRKKQSSPYEAFFFLGQKEELQDPYEMDYSYLSSICIAEYRVNNQGSYTPMPSLSPISLFFDVASSANTSPTVCSISVLVSSTRPDQIQPDTFTFLPNSFNLSALSSTAIAFEDTFTTDVYAFYWPVNGKVSDSVTSLLTSVEALTGRRLIIRELETSLIEAVLSAKPLPGISEVFGLTDDFETEKTTEFNSASSVVQSIYDTLKRETTFETISGSNFLQIVQTSPEDPTFQSLAVGAVSFIPRRPFVSSNNVTYLEMSGVFFNEFPTIDFIAFPKNVVDLDSLPTRVNIANYSNYQEVCKDVGVAFCGEGHTETIYLSATTKNTSEPSIRWLVGNGRINPETVSNFVINGSAEKNFTATVVVPTFPHQNTRHPIVACIIDPKNYLTINSPLITYSDIDDEGIGGDMSYYPFVCSTQEVDGQENPDNTIFRDSIQVTEYPDPIPLNISDPFPSKSLKLPFQNDSRRFVASISKSPNLSSHLTANFQKTFWKLTAKTPFDDSWSIEANTTPDIENYVFDLSYDEDFNTNYLPLFKTSSYAKTTVTLEVSCITEIKIEISRNPTDVFSFDYKPNELSSSALAIEDIETQNIYVYYWGGYGTDTAVKALTSTLESSYETVSVVNLGAPTTAQQMITGLYQAITDANTNIEVLSTNNRLFLTQPKINNTTNYVVTAIGNRIQTSYEPLPVDQTDWKTVVKPQVFKFTTEVLPRPLSIKPFTPSFYNLKYTEIPFVLYYEEHEPYRLSAIDIECPLSLEKTRFYPSIKNNKVSKIGLKQTAIQNITFNKIGLADLKITAYIVDTQSESPSSSVFSYVTQFNDVIEVVDEYDVVDEGYLYSWITPPQRTYTEPPLLSPNEWLISDNINDSIKKLYRSFQDINELTLIYDKKDYFHSWMEISRAAAPEPFIRIQKYIWEDLLCNDETLGVDQTSWFNFECENPEDSTQTKNITWEQHVCNRVPEPNCTAKYCVQWSWKKRKAKNSSTKITWKATKKGNRFQKKWLFEKCENDSNELLCDKFRWNVFAFDKKAFPIPYAYKENNCRFVDVDFVEGEDFLVVAHPQVIRLFKNNMEADFFAQKGTADELFSFQEIAGVAVDSEGKIFVLDKILPKVTILQYAEDSLNLYDSWGNFGYRGNAAGFNAPQDIHIDQDNFVWIADTGNGCIKKFTANGRPVLTLTNEIFEQNPPLSLCVDANYNLHVMLSNKILIFDSNGSLVSEYAIDQEMVGLARINVNYNREMVYVCYENGVAKYFKTGALSHYLIKDYVCGDGETLQGFNSVFQNESRDTHVVSANKILKFGDLMKLVETKGRVSDSSYWSLDEILINKEEFVQPWVYLRAFHRIWDNIETVRAALFYQEKGCRVYREPIHPKSSLIIGQNELVTNTVLNRLIKQIWENIETLFKYFNPECEKNQK